MTYSSVEIRKIKSMLDDLQLQVTATILKAEANSKFKDACERDIMFDSEILERPDWKGLTPQEHDRLRTLAAKFLSFETLAAIIASKLPDYPFVSDAWEKFTEMALISKEEGARREEELFQATMHMRNQIVNERIRRRNGNQDKPPLYKPALQSPASTFDKDEAE